MRSARVAPADEPADPPAAARVRVDLQARDAYIANNKSRLEAAFSTAVNLLADTRPEDPFTFVALRLREMGLEQGEQAQANNMNAQSERPAQVPVVLRPLREKAAKVLAPIKQSAASDDGSDAHGDDHMVKLPDALRKFLPLAKTETIEAACGPLHELELAVARDPDSKVAVDALRAQLVVLMKVTATAIADRTEGMGEEAAQALIKACEAAITAGNKDFLGVYQNVFNVIKSGDADGMDKYEKAICDLDAAIKKPAVAAQRDEAGDAAVLFADAARMKPSFDDVVREVAAATGAGLELAMLSTNEDATSASDDGGAGQGGARKARTGLKKTSRVIEKSALRPDEGRGLSKCVCDVVRAMLVATSMSVVATIVWALRALHEADMIQVVRIKNRFGQPSAGGWRDLMVNFVIVGDATRHVCEVQVVHEMMLTARKGLPGHAIYGIVRNAMELIESCGREHELRREVVRVMVQEGKTDVELIGAFEDAWVLADPEWAEGVEGGRDALVKKAIKVDREEGRLSGLVLSKIWMKEALPASVARLTALQELHMEDCKLLNPSVLGEALKVHGGLMEVRC